ncbi:MAG: TetR/AcrR family transcriptional regulator [Acidimicrobiales bacterium]
MSGAVSKRQERAAATAEQLLAAARQVFETRGYQASTVGAITKAASTAHGTFYLYFKNKEDAFAKVIGLVCQEMYLQVRAAWTNDIHQSLHEATRAYVEVFAAHPGLWRALLEGALQRRAIAEIWMELRRPFIHRIAANLGRLAELGLIRKMDAEATANAMGSMVEWFCFLQFVLDRPGPQCLTKEQVVEVLSDLWYHAVYGGTTATLGAGLPDMGSPVGSVAAGVGAGLAGRGTGPSQALPEPS